MAELTPRERARSDLAVAVNNDPQSMRDNDFARLRDLGLNDREILEGNSISAFIGGTNRSGIALTVPPDPEYTGIPPEWDRHSA